MISQMDQVYANASVTIVAAAGDNVEMGLPGVSIFPRQPQQWEDIQNITLLELPCGEHDLLSSKWASRGWTYQEGYLSKRRIIFTPHQVLVLCNNQYLEEYVHLSLNGQGGPPYRSLDKLTSIFPAFSPSGDLSESNLLRQVEEYSQRQLSYSSDSLNAFLGILNYTLGRFGGLYPTTHLGWGLLAAHNNLLQSSRLHLDWYHIVPAERRYEFPSWAWTGWAGRLHVGEGILVCRKDVKHRLLPHLTWKVSVEAEGEKTLDMCDFVRICLTDAGVANVGPHPKSVELSPRRLLITCRVLPVRFGRVSLTEAERNQGTKLEFERTRRFWMIGRSSLDNRSLAFLEVWDGIYVGTPYDLDQGWEQKNCVTGLLFLSLDSLDHEIPQIGCLLVRQLEDGFYERIGLVRNIIPFPVDWDHWQNSSMIFLDEMGSVIDRFKVPDGRRGLPFDQVGRTKTICLL